MSLQINPDQYAQWKVVLDVVKSKLRQRDREACPVQQILAPADYYFFSFNPITMNIRLATVISFHIFSAL